MTDKEIIEIDGINVLECEHYQYKSLKDCEMRYPESGDCEIGLINYLFNGNLDMEKLCVDNPNCYFKQLARKTQECEELKETLNKLTRGVVMPVSEPEVIDLTARYRKALEEIEGLVKNFCKDCGDYENCNWDKEGCYYSLIPNLKDIINKAKDGN